VADRGRTASRHRHELRRTGVAPLDNRRLPHLLKRVRESLAKHDPPVVSLMAQGARDPFRVLISTLMSSRTKDEVTAAGSERLFSRADTPEALLRLPESQIARLIFPVGFYRTKARSIRQLCRVLVEGFGGRVPDDLDTLTELPGVGRKTANLVLVEGFRKPAICVDTHVHRITNLWGYVETKTPQQTETALRGKLPRRYWLEINKLLVKFGQTICVPLSPKCSECPIERWCPKIGVTRSR
jgi:endonuclease-3